MLLRKMLVLLLCPPFIVPIAPGSNQNSQLTPAQPQLIALYEAEILIYLLPEAHEVRRQGMEIGWELQANPAYNLEDFYVFWIVNAKRPRVHGSVTIGFFGVNKHTADVWAEGIERFVVTPELVGVQGILRKSHHIDEATIEKYRSRRPGIPLPPSNQ